jgi:hypothetical protein
MKEGLHNHWNKYIHRIKKVIVGETGLIEILQLICIDDGIIFHEVKIREREER